MKKILILVLLIQFSFGLNAQNRDLFDRIDNPVLSSVELDNLNYLKDLYGIEQRIVIVDESLIRLNVEILIEAFGEESTFRVDRMHSPNPSNWYASLISDDGHTGGISSIDGVLFGELHDNTGSYNLSPLQEDGRDDRYVITKHVFENGETVNVKCDTHDHITSHEDDIDVPSHHGGSSGTRSSVTIDILALRTESVNFFDIFAISHVINQLNMIDDNSDIADIHFNLVGIDVVDYLESGTFGDMFDDLVENAEVKDLRNAYGADVVLIGLDYNSESDTWGRAATIDINNEKSIAVAQISKFVRDHTGVHEIYHLFDCGHELGESQIEPYQHAYYMSWWSNREHGTVMFSGIVNDETILYLSNPDVDYDPGWWWDEQATGDQFRDNARRAEETAPTVEDFRPSQNGFNPVVTIGGGDDLDDLTFSYLTMCKNELKKMFWINSENVPEPFDASWEISNDGITYAPITLLNTIPFGMKIDQLTESLIYIRTNSNPVPGNYTIRLKVTKDGVESTDYLLLNILDCPNIVGDGGDESATRGLSNNEDIDVTVFPTVIAQDNVINVKTNQTGLTFVLNRISGEHIKSGVVVENNTIDVFDLHSGMYFLSLFSGDRRILSQKILKQ